MCTALALAYCCLLTLVQQTAILQSDTLMVSTFHAKKNACVGAADCTVSVCEGSFDYHHYMQVFAILNGCGCFQSCNKYVKGCYSK